MWEGRHFWGFHVFYIKTHFRTIFPPFWVLLGLLLGALGASLGAIWGHLGPLRATWGRQRDTSCTQSPPKTEFCAPNVVFRAPRGLQNTQNEPLKWPPGAPKSIKNLKIKLFHQILINQIPRINNNSKSFISKRSRKHPGLTTPLAPFKKTSSKKCLPHILYS